MALTPSTMQELGTPAPDFSLPEPEDGKTYGLEDFASADALLVIFMCNHCPYVVHLKEALADFAREYADKGLAVVGINANDPESHPDDAPERMAEEKKKYGYPFPYLFDGSQQTAGAYGAACTPDFFLYDKDRKLAYRGQFDDSRPRNDQPITGKDLRAAVDAVLAGRRPPEDQKPSMGCNIKWKPGNEPAYAA